MKPSPFRLRLRSIEPPARLMTTTPAKPMRQPSTLRTVRVSYRKMRLAIRMAKKELEASIIEDFTPVV